MDKIFDASAPMVTLTNEFFASVSIFFAVIIFLGVYTTATPMVWLISSAFVNEKSKWYKMLVAVVTILGLVGGYLLPFGTIVGFLYTYAGYFGIFFLLAMAYKQIKNKLFAKQVEGPDQEISID